MAQTEIDYNLSNIDDAAKTLWNIAKDLSLWSFVGEMGAGKTTLIAAICRHLKVQDSVNSPTYTIVNEYHFHIEGINKIIYHADWYRLKDAQDAIHAGMEDILHRPNSYSFIEWASKAPELLKNPYLKIELNILEEDKRRVKFSIQS